MTVSAVQQQSAEGDVRIKALLSSFRQVGLPLLLALGAAEHTDGTVRGTFDSAKFAALVTSTVRLAADLGTGLGASEDSCDAWVRWALAGAASQIVGASFQATGKPLSQDDVAVLSSLVRDLQNQFSAALADGKEPLPNTVATFRAKSLEALVPVIGAISRYSFGRAEHGLVGEVAEKILRTSDQITRTLAPAGASPEEWRLLCWSVLRAAGQIYADSHYAEADRLLYMEPDARAAYYAQHGNVPPMTQVWQSFNQRMAMLATLASYLEVPSSAKLDDVSEEHWVSP